jgi:hypothetical protein
MTIDRGSRELLDPVDDLVVCGDAVVTVRADVTGRVEVLEAGTLKLYGYVAGDVEVNTAGRVDIHGVVEGDLRVTAGEVRVIGTVGAVTGEHATAVKLCSGCLVAGRRHY